MGRLKKLFKGESKAPATPSFDPKPEETDKLPLIPYRILYTDLPFYNDPACEDKVPDARVAILEALDPENELMELDVLPTRKEYEPGQLVTFNLNNKRLWEECWFRNPETQQVERAWNLHVEFIGDVISQKTLDENKDRLRELDEKFSKAKEAKTRTGNQQERIN